MRDVESLPQYHAPAAQPQVCHPFSMAPKSLRCRRLQCPGEDAIPPSSYAPASPAPPCATMPRLSFFARLHANVCGQEGDKVLLLQEVVKRGAVKRGRQQAVAEEAEV